MGEYTGKKYYPSGGEEGRQFEDRFCMNCIHTNPDPTKKPQCDIWCAATCFDVSDDKFPKEWTCDENDNAVCTAWKKWDWEKYGDPYDLDNPNAPQKSDPNQAAIEFTE